MNPPSLARSLALPTRAHWLFLVVGVFTTVPIASAQAPATPATGASHGSSPTAIAGIPNLPDVVTVVPFYTKANETAGERTKVYIPAELSGLHTNLNLDTGDPGIDLNRTYLQPSPTGGIDSITDANRIPEHDGGDAVHVTLRIGTIEVASKAHPLAAKLNHAWGNYSWVFAPRLGNIGLTVLEPFETIIDYTHRRVILIRLDSAGHRLAAVPAYTPKWTAPLVDVDHNAGPFWGIAVAANDSLDTLHVRNNIHYHILDTGTDDYVADVGLQHKILGYGFLSRFGVVGFNHRTHQFILYQ